MKTFKKIITLALVLSMLATLFIPMGVSADDAVETKTWAKTSDLWSKNSNTNLEAVKTTTAPTLDGVKDTVWDNAQPLVLNGATRNTINDANFTSAGKIYMLYDNTNLYLLFDVESGTIGGVNIVPERNFEADKTIAAAAAGTVAFDGYMPNFTLVEGEATEATTPTITSRRFVYGTNDFTASSVTGNGANNAKKEDGWTAADGEVSRITGLDAKYIGKSGDYVMEIVIPWAYLGCTQPTAFGIKFSATGYHIGQNGTSNIAWYDGKSINQDCAWHDPVTLKDAKGATPAYVTESAKYPLTTAITNTNQFFNPTSNTDLGFYKATSAITVDGTKEAIWDNAVPLVLNRTTAAIIDTSAYNNNNARATDISFMYDAQGIYILEENKGGLTTPAGNITFLFLPEKAVTVDEEYDMYGFIASAANAVTIRHGNITENTFSAKYTNFAKDAWTESTTAMTVSAATMPVVPEGQQAPGYVREFFIPWASLGFAAAPADGSRIGVKINPVDRGYHMGGVAEDHYLGTDGHRMANASGAYLNLDCYNYDSATLRTAKPTTKAPYLEIAEAVAAMETKYYAEGVTVVEISSALDLKALNQLFELKGNRTATVGKTIKLTADIDLNPGVDWATYTPENVYFGVYTGTLPTYRWISFGDIEWNFDGQGHKLNGLWIPDDTQNNTDNTGTQKDDSRGHYQMSAARVGFMGRFYGTGGVKNVVFENGYMRADADRSGIMFGFVAGELRSVNNYLENIYIGKDVTVEATFFGKSSFGDDAYGAVVGRVHDSASGVLKIKNVVFDGKFVVDYCLTNSQRYIGKFAGVALPMASGENATVISAIDVVFGGTIDARSAFDATTVNVPLFNDTMLYTKAEDQQSTCRFNRVYASVAEATADTANAVYLATMADGRVLPIVVAEMVSGIYAQNNTANKDVVRIVTEINSLDWAKFGYKITAVRADGKVATFDDTANTKVYNAVTAGGAQVTANAAPFDVMNGAALYAVELKGIDTTTTYTVTIVPTWTINDSVIEGCAHTFTLPVAN